MPICQVCKENFKSLNTLVLHLNHTHNFNYRSVYKCCEKNCLRSFQDLFSFKKHIKTKHSNSFEVEQKASQDEVPTHDVTDNDLFPVALSVNHCGTSTNSGLKTTDETNKDFTSILEQEVLSLISSLYATNGLNRKHVQTIIDSISTFLNAGFLNTLKSEVLPKLSNENRAEVDNISEKFDRLMSCFQNLNSEYLRFNDLERKGLLIKPVDFSVGTRFDNVPVNDSIRIVPVVCKATKVSLAQTLKSFLALPGVLSSLCTYLGSLENDILSCNIVQGDLWKLLKSDKTISDDELLLPLVIYFDEFETCNPLGPRAGIHKLGAVYASIPCLPPQVISQLENIFLVQLFHASDRVQFGNEAVFGHLIQELNHLDTEGIFVNQNKIKKIFFKVVVILGDNLGVHGILGFTESFSANYPCRFCKLTKPCVPL